MQQLSLLKENFPPPSKASAPELLMHESIPYDAVEALLEAFLEKELDEFEMMDVQAVPETSPNVKWKYSSAFQKSIRRRNVADAIKYALTYHAADPVGFWSRLVVIAFEDVGVNGAMEVAITLAVTRSKIFRRKLGGDIKVIHYVIKKLAESVKDRTVCDLFQVLENRPQKADALTILKSATLQGLSEIALSDSAPVQFRISAAWLLFGTDRFKNGKFPLRTGSRDWFDYTIEQMKIPGLVKYICLRGMVACKCAMNLTYPFVWLMMKQSPYVKVIGTALPDTLYIKGLPDFGFDMHTREGKAAYQYFYKACEPVGDFLTSRCIVGSDEVVSAIGIAVFIGESALLDRRVDFGSAEEIYWMTVEDDYKKNGLSLTDGLALTRLIQDNSKTMRRSRQMAVEDKRGVTRP